MTGGANYAATDLARQGRQAGPWFDRSGAPGLNRTLTPPSKPSSLPVALQRQKAHNFRLYGAALGFRPLKALEPDPAQTRRAPFGARLRGIDENRHSPAIQRNPGDVQLRQHVHHALDRAKSRCMSRCARRAIRSIRASRRSWTPPAASRSSASASGQAAGATVGQAGSSAGGQERRHQKRAAKGAARREERGKSAYALARRGPEGSFGCLFCWLADRRPSRRVERRRPP